MDNILTQLNLLLEQYNVFIALVAIILLVWGIYSRIRFLCLKKASEMVSKAEGYENLTGEEKLAMCVVWIEEELPKVFRNTLLSTITEKLINYIYRNSFSFMKNYVKRKTGYDISEIIKMIENDAMKEEKKAEE